MTTVVGLQGDGYCLLAADTRITTTDTNGVGFINDDARIAS
jgi:20S proteasome alpha/beta subunit